MKTKTHTLVDAAPDLLVALNETLKALRIAYAACYCGPQSWTQATKEAYRLEACDADAHASAAIAKAEGRE